MALFGRQVILQLGVEDDVGKEYRGFRVRFRVETSRSSNPNKAVIEAYNLNKESVSLAQQPEAIVRLLVGYDAPLQIFRGNPVKDGVELIKQGPDRVLHIEAQDGQRQLEAARLNLSFATDTTAQQVFDEVSAALGLPLGTVRLGDLNLSQGVVLNGPARKTMDELALSLGLEWFVRDGVLQVVTAGESTGETAVVFSSATGNLIGSPKRLDDGGVEATALISPSLRPGKPFRVESEDITGDYIADEVVLEGDSGWERPFYVIAAGKAA